MNKISGIYTLTNIVNGKIYVGYTNDLKERGWEHFKELNGKYHKNKHLQSAYNQYGRSNFIYETLEEYPLELLGAMEHYWATILRVHDSEFGYNLKPTHPDNKSVHSLETIETIEKIKNSKKGKKRTDNYWLGRHHSEETKEILRQQRIGKKRKPHTEETKNKMSETHKKRIIIITPEHRDKMDVARKAKPRSEKQIAQW